MYPLLNGSNELYLTYIHYDAIVLTMNDKDLGSPLVCVTSSVSKRSMENGFQGYVTYGFVEFEPEHDTSHIDSEISDTTQAVDMLTKKIKKTQ